MDEDPDIDIEENNLLYPRIESIYSDVNIKTEPIDIDEEDYESMNLTESSSDYYMTIPNKIILGTKPSSQNVSEPVAGPSNATDNWEEPESYFNCKDCTLLFPTQNELDSHNMTSHSYLVARPISKAIRTDREMSLTSTSSHSFYDDSSSQEEHTKRRQKAVKSTSKSALNKTFPILHRALKNQHSNPYDNTSPERQRTIANVKDCVSDGLICKHCNQKFPNEIALIKHTYELLPESNIECDVCRVQFKTKAAMKSHRLIHFRNIDTDETLFQCVFCSCYLMYPRTMKKHLLKNHKVTEFVMKQTKFTGKCGLCSKHMNNYKQSNKHVMQCHEKEFFSKTTSRFDVVSKKVKCLLCDQNFASWASAYKHKSRKHPKCIPKEIFAIVTHEKPVKQIPANNTSVKAETQSKSPSKSRKSSKIGFIPKQTLFKCYKCQIHFVKCWAASTHCNRCSLAKGDWKCSKCRRTFTNVDKTIHTLQHKFSDKFKVHVMSDRILCKLLYQCPNCEVHFDETGVRTHTLADCDPDNVTECKVCNLKIHSDSIIRHKRNHNKYNFRISDYIFVPLVDASSEKSPPKKEEVVVKEDNTIKQELLYCTICKCYSYTYKRRNFHVEGRCKLLSRRYCQICGLVFSMKPYNKHMILDHKTNNLQLYDFLFKKVDDSKVINPVMPDFYQCVECEVRFVSPVIRKHHDCSKERFLKCSQCSEKYDSVTYDIHLAFHNYGHPKISENSSLKFYSCVPCNYGFQSYDGIVEHCQRHYTNSEAMITQPCKHCRLDYADDHEGSHSDKAKFEIYKFDYEKLLTENWLDGFDSLSKDAVADILSRSVYGVVRIVRLELLLQGPAERTLYKCVQCEITFDEEDVVEHAAEACTDGPRFKCGSCSATFKTRDSKTKHANIHVVYGDEITFREITFNNESDKELNEALRTGRPKESLKFRKCPECELLIKKSDYQKHVAAHKNKFLVKTFTGRRKGKYVTFKLFKPKNSAKKMYTMYKCRLCNISIQQEPNVARHNCVPEEFHKKCRKCSLYFLTWAFAKHMTDHKKDPNYIFKNIAVVEFVNMGDRTDFVMQRRLCSSDDDASTLSRLNVPVLKTYETRKITGKPYSDSLSENSQDNEDGDVPRKTTPNAYAKRYIKKACVEKNDSVKENEESQDTDTTDAGENEKSEKKLSSGRWRTEMRNKLYQCDKCYLFFKRNMLLVSHLTKCNNNNSAEKPLICDRCNIIFHPSLIAFHEKLHEQVKKNPVENYFYLTNISTKGYKINHKERWLYKCKECNIHFLSIGAIESHFSENHRLEKVIDCEICGLKFSQISRTKHIKLQHSMLKMSRHELHMEIIEKKIVNEGEIKLASLTEPNNLEKTCNVEIKEICQVDSPLIEAATETEGFIEKTPKLGIDHRLYKCHTCSKHYLTDYTLARHIFSEGHTASGVNCNICGLIFSSRTLDVHKRTQHDKLKLSREDFVIICKNEIVTRPIKEELNDSEVVNNVSDQSFNISESANNTNESQNADDSEDFNDSERNKYKELKKELKLPVHKNNLISNHIYKCVECSIFYTNRQTLLLHIVVRKHKNFKTLECDLCGFMFGSGSLKKHKAVQHQQLKLRRDDFIITDVFGSRILDSKDDDENISVNTSSIDIDGSLNKEILQNDQQEVSRNDSITNDIDGSRTFDENILDNSNKNTLSVETDGRLLKQLDDKAKCESKVFVKGKEIKMFRLYQCMNCKVCVERSQRNLHVCCSDIQKIQCISCCLLFRISDVREHRRLHFKHRELSRKNFVLIRFGHGTSKDNRIYKCESCSTHFVNVVSLEWHMDTWNHQTKRAYCKSCGLFFGKNCLSRHIYIHHKKLKLSVEEFKIVCVSDANKNALNVHGINAEANNVTNGIGVAVSEQNTTPNLNAVRKLFKCMDCDVYFLTRASYYNHIYKHRKLDATEFIDCNICDLQFLNESLGIHMKSHKDKSFYLDNLLIEEYQPNNTESLGIKTYFAKDNFNSKLVSTTTPFDNDDDTVLTETDEQLSIIDSTSDELPKANAGNKVEAVHNNIFPLNSEPSPEERTLNQNVEVPDKDVCVKLAE